MTKKIGVLVGSLRRDSFNKKIAENVIELLPEGYEAIIRPRSGLSLKGIDECIGTIDSNYRGEVKACIVNNSEGSFDVRSGDRICQLAIRKTEDIVFEQVENLSETNRGDNGFGSSGI